MLHRTTKECWKCGQEVTHRRVVIGLPKTLRRLRSWIRNRGIETPIDREQTVPTKHYVEKNKGFIECPGSGRAA